MHLWLPDAHSQAPTPVSALLSGVLIKCALLGIIRFQTIAAAACGPAFPADVLLVFGLVSVVVATPFILAQHDVKRLLGYHSVEHVGIVALGLGFGGPRRHLRRAAARGEPRRHQGARVLRRRRRPSPATARATCGSSGACSPWRRSAATLLMLAALVARRHAAVLDLRERAHGAARRHRPRPLGGDRDLPRDGRRHLRRPPPPRRRDGLRRADGGGGPGARGLVAARSGWCCSRRSWSCSASRIPASLDRVLLRRATEIVVG